MFPFTLYVILRQHLPIRWGSEVRKRDGNFKYFATVLEEAVPFLYSRRTKNIYLLGKNPKYFFGARRKVEKERHGTFFGRSGRERDR